jgi:osmotically-inducible protein OsmY
MVKRHRLLSILICIGLVAVFVGCASTRTQQSAGEKVDDSVITTKVKAAIFNEPTLKVFQINVETFKGEVQLSGFVDTAVSVKKAGEVARGVKGVVSVKNNLIVK